MWLVKKAASKVKQIKQTVIKEQTQAEKLINNIISNSNTIMPMKEMSELASKSFEMDWFEDIVRFTADKLNDIKIEKKSLKKRLNLLVLVTYLIKYGAGGFIDQFRALDSTFTRYEVLQQTEGEEKLKIILNDLNQRAEYIKTLLNDKNVLLREKEIAWMIRQKMTSQIGDYSQHSKKYEYSNTNEGEAKQQNEQKMQKVETFLEMYVWKYTSKIDRKLDEITDAIINKIDDYLDGQIPESFDIDELEEKKQVEQSPQKKTKKKSKDSIDIKQEESGFVKEKNQIEQNLLDLKEEPKVQIIPAKGKQQLEETQSQTIELPVIKLDLPETKTKSDGNLEEKKAQINAVE